MSLRVEDDGVVREHALPMTPGFWQYVSIDANTRGTARLSLVGRGEDAAHVAITAASVRQ